MHDVFLLFCFTERGDDFDWEAFINEQAAKHGALANKHLSGMNKII